MKKYLIPSTIFAIISFIGMVNVSAASVNSQSIDVRVGEVDEINTDDENQDLHTPDTGLFGLEASSASVIMITAIPAIIILVCIFGYICRKHTKNNNNKTNPA